MGSLRGPKINAHAVRAIRLAQGKSQVTLAREAQLDHSYVSRLEAGQRCHPAPGVLKQLAEALGVPMTALLVDPEVLVP